MNDSNEITYGLDKFLTIIKQNIRGLEKEILSRLIKNIRDTYNIYIICFSNTSRSLPMWRFYGDAGNGIAIGVDRAISAEHEKHNRIHEDFKICSVSYEDAAFQEVEGLVESLNLIMSHHSFKKRAKRNKNVFY